MMENRKILTTSDLDGFDKRKLPSPGFQLEVVLADYDGTNPLKPTLASVAKESTGGSGPGSGDTTNDTTRESSTTPNPNKDSGNQDKDDVFSDSEAEESAASKSRHVLAAGNVGPPDTAKGSETKTSQDETVSIARGTEKISLKTDGPKPSPDASEPRSDGATNKSPASTAPEPDSSSVSEFKAIAADASVFSFGDEDDYESE